MTIENRDFEIRSVDHDKREVSGLAVPYGQTIDVGGFSERFERGAIAGVEDVLLFWNHQEPIGKVIRGEDTEDGYSITAVLSKTTRGEEAYTLLKDGVIKKFSVGFLPKEDRMEGKTIVRTKVNLKEVSLVPFPAYEGAKVSEVRSEENTNTKEDIKLSNEIENVDVSELRDSVADLERRMALFGSEKTEGSKPEFRSGAEFLKALASGSQEARDFGTSVEADIVRPAWVNERMRMDLESRPTINAFSKGALPQSGNSVEYPFVKTVTGTVAKQALEGDALSYMEVALDTATAPVSTYGGYSSLSRQAIERSDLAYLETVLEYQVRQYAKATEAAVRTALAGGVGYNTATVAADTAVGWIDAVVDSAAAIEDNSQGERAEFALASRDVFKRLAHMVDGSNRPLFNVSGQAVNALGSSNIVSPAINVGGLQVIVNPALANNSFYVAASSAIKTWESAGAPFRLQDENIINLTKDFSLYGYMAVAVLNAKAITKVDVDLV